MRQAIRAGSLYFLIVFAVGFLLGTIRVLILTPQFGALTSVIIETPVILLISWLVCQRLIRMMNVDRALNARLTMGATAFLLLIAAEQILGVIGFGRELGEQLRHYLTPEGAVGLAGQIVFALFPAIQLVAKKRP